MSDAVQVIEKMLLDLAYQTPAGTWNCRFCDCNLDHQGTYQDMHDSDCIVHELRNVMIKYRGVTMQMVREAEEQGIWAQIYKARK